MQQRRPTPSPLTSQKYKKKKRDVPIDNTRSKQQNSKYLLLREWSSGRRQDDEQNDWRKNEN